MLFIRYIKTLALLLLLPAGWSVSLLPLLLVWPHVGFDFLLPALIVWAALYLLPLPFFLRLIIHKVWFFKGRGKPVLQKELELMLLAVNDFQNPVQARKKYGGIRLNWRCDDPEWCRRMALTGLRQNYELELKFNSSIRTVVMQDRVRRVNFSRCPVRVKNSLLTSSRFFCHVRTGAELGINTFEQTAAHNYRFRPQELKSPIFNIILRNGWNVQFELY